MDLRDFHGTLNAPYRRFRPTTFYGDDYVNGSFTGDIMFCNWTCEHCWSMYGWRGVEPDPKKIFSADQVVVKLVEGMKRNAQGSCRLSGGEATLYWDHLYAVAKGVIEETTGKVLKVPGVTDAKGDPFAFIFETNGAAGLDFDKLDRLDQDFGEEGKRICLGFGVKSTSAEGLARLTGMAPAAAKAAHEKQMRNLLYAAIECKNLTVFAGFLEQFTDMEVFGAIQREFERAKPGTGVNLELYPMKRYGDANRFYTPKRFRPEALKAAGELVMGDEDDESGAPTMSEDTPEAIEKLAAAVSAIRRQDLPTGKLSK